MAGLLTNAARRELKVRAQKLKPILRVGQEGMSDGFLKSLDAALAVHELVKIKFASFKEEKKTLAPQLADRTGSELIMRVGNVAVYYRVEVREEDRQHRS